MSYVGPINSPAALLNLRRTIGVLIFVLVFEGLGRKLQIPYTSVPIFFIKDVLVLLIALQLSFLRQPRALEPIWIAYVTVCFLFLPVFISTLTHDPLLAVFGLKQYLLYPVVALGFVTAFEYSPLSEIVRMMRRVTFLIVPTTIIAVIQQHLSPDHWLNLSVEGAQLGNFSSAGHLRISSTFSFVAQYCAFLNFALVTAVVSLHGLGALRRWQQLFFIAMLPAIFLCSYMTGSRGAVMGNLGALAIGIGLIILRLDLRNTIRIIGIGTGILIVISRPVLDLLGAGAGPPGRRQRRNHGPRVRFVLRLDQRRHRRARPRLWHRDHEQRQRPVQPICRHLPRQGRLDRDRFCHHPLRGRSLPDHCLVRLSLLCDL
jgi:hypothetical protein